MNNDTKLLSEAYDKILGTPTDTPKNEESPVSYDQSDYEFNWFNAAETAEELASHLAGNMHTLESDKNPEMISMMKGVIHYLTDLTDYFDELKAKQSEKKYSNPVS